jgi:hypothetical protein
MSFFLQYRAELFPRSADARAALGDAYRQSGQIAKARECDNQTLSLAPGSELQIPEYHCLECDMHSLARECNVSNNLSARITESETSIRDVIGVRCGVLMLFRFAGPCGH